jgi:hypothetical protein
MKHNSSSVACGQLSTVSPSIGSNLLKEYFTTRPPQKQAKNQDFWFIKIYI